MTLTTITCTACGRREHTTDVRALTEIEGWKHDAPTDRYACSRRCVDAVRARDEREGRILRGNAYLRRPRGVGTR